ATFEDVRAGVGQDSNPVRPPHAVVGQDSDPVRPSTGLESRPTAMGVPVGEEGLLLVSGANVMKGYLGNDDLTRKKIVGGWYVTGDLAKMDEDGFVTITGREERFAKIGGEMVPLEKVEEELHEVLGSSEKLCAVTAIPDGKKGERLIVLHLLLSDMTTKDLWKGLMERGLPAIYIPGQRDFIQVPELPVLGTGKLDLKKCKELAMELANATAGA